jgi:uncharacterized membrane protein HdeD (DUF308 family)
VGTLSMGLILVASGILMLVSLVAQVDVLRVLLTFWPIILISLGVEILLHLFLKKDEGTKLRYDVLSVVFISFLLVISIGFYFVAYAVSLFESWEALFCAFGVAHIAENCMNCGNIY